MHLRIILSVLAVLVILTAGCSSASHGPVYPNGPSNDFELPVPNLSQSDISGSLSGIWNARLDISKLSVEITEDREAAQHFNITSFLARPSMVFNSYDPSTGIADIDITITNPTTITGSDVRLIIYTDSIGHKLMNFDSWTALYDISGGLPINPFMAFAKSATNRKFAGKMEYTENCHIKLPGGNSNIKFAIEASYPGNCDEPYEIRDFVIGNLNSTTGSSALAEAKVLDWQNNANSLKLYCPQVTNVNLVPFTQGTPPVWNATVYNNAGASAGDYTGYLMATSSNTSIPLYTEVVIHVSGTTTQPVGNLVITVNRTPDDGTFNRLNNGIKRDRPWTLSWQPVSGAVEYAIYYDTNPSDGLSNNFIFVGSTTFSSVDVPSSHLPANNYVPGLTYTVRARSKAGDPASESSNSELAHIIVSCFDSLPPDKPLGMPNVDSEGWVLGVERNPYATVYSWQYQPVVHGQAGMATSDPYRCSFLPANTFGGDWTVGTGSPTDQWPGHILAVTKETPSVPNSTIRLFQFVGFCSNPWDVADEGGLIIGWTDNQPRDGWDGHDFHWAQAFGTTDGYERYRHTHPYNPAYQFPFDMSDYTAGPNCWRWEG
jgi:hypothetical protein